MALSVDVIPNRSSPPAILLREAWRDGARIRRRTLANLSKMPPVLVDAVRAALAGGVILSGPGAAVAIRRAWPQPIFNKISRKTAKFGRSVDGMIFFIY